MSHTHTFPHNALVPPIFLTTTFGQPSEYEYSRVSNPTRLLLEQKLAELEKGAHALACSSGQAAALLVASTLKQGSRILIHNDCYDGTLRLLHGVFEPFGLTTTSTDLTDLSKAKAALKQKPDFVWFESPTNPLLDIIDIRGIIQLAHQQKTRVVVDNTFAGPCSQTPLTMGADLVIESLTKSLNGHADVTGGAVITNDQELFDRLKFNHHTLGIALAPFDAFLVERGLKTLNLRVRRTEQSAMRLARFLNKHPKIVRVSFPWLHNHPHKHLARKQMAGPGSVVTFWIKGTGQTRHKFLKALNLITTAHSLGGCETLIQHPRSMMHHSLTTRELNHKGLTTNMFRLSVGLEESQDLINDITQALNTL